MLFSKRIDAMKMCVKCGNEFEPNSNRQKYCADCGRRPKLVCEHCGKEFTSTNNAQRFCSSSCWYEFNTDKDKQRKICPVCGKEFKPLRSDQKTCSRECGGKAQRKRYKKCVVCEKEFIGKTSQQQTCSHECAGVLRRGERILHCERCGKEIPYTGYNGRRFCSKECRNAPLGSTYEKQMGYIMIKVGKEHPYTDRAGYIFQHRYVVEQQIRRYLGSHERVHHKNGEKSDNRPENLELWSVKDPAGQRLLDKAKNIVQKLPENERKLLLEWMQTL